MLVNRNDLLEAVEDIKLANRIMILADKFSTSIGYIKKQGLNRNGAFSNMPEFNMILLIDEYKKMMHNCKIKNRREQAEIFIEQLEDIRDKLCKQL